MQLWLNRRIGSLFCFLICQPSCHPTLPPPHPIYIKRIGWRVRAFTRKDRVEGQRMAIRWTDDNHLSLSLFLFTPTSYIYEFSFDSETRRRRRRHRCRLRWRKRRRRRRMRAKIGQPREKGRECEASGGYFFVSCVSKYSTVLPW